MTATTSTTEPTTESPADERFVEHPLAPGRIAIHDPAIVEDNGTYYVFGTHRRCARSTDLVHWERFENNLTRDPASLLGGIWEAWPKQPENPALEGNTWAPDVIWNDVMRKWCMYLSVNGHEFRSVIVLLTADRLDGDWTYVGPVVYSGFNVDNVGRTGGYQIRLFRSRNLVGPYVDQNGNPAISNGEIPDNQTKDTGIRLTSSVKWSGGPADDDTVEVSQGHNSVLTRGSDGRLFLTYHTRFIDRVDDDYETHVRELLPTADGWLTAAPYEYRGAAAVPPTAANTSDPTVGDDDDGFDDYIVAPSSAPNLAARLCHCVRPVHESDLAHPSLVSGDYEFVRHDPHAYFNGTRNADGTWHGVNLPETITLQPDGRVTSGGVVDFFDTPDANLPRSTNGPVSRGSWRMLGATPAGVHCCDSDMAITIDGMTYTGVFAVLPRETDGRATLTFSAIGGNQAIWGARIEG